MATLCCLCKLRRLAKKLKPALRKQLFGPLFPRHDLLDWTTTLSHTYAGLASMAASDEAGLPCFVVSCIHILFVP